MTSRPPPIRRAATLLAVAWAFSACSEGDTDSLVDAVVIADQNITAVEVTTAKTVIAVAETLPLTASNGAGGIDITSLLSWTSSAPAVATVDGAGVVTGVADGTAAIRAQIGDIQGSVDLTVSSAALASIDINSPTMTIDACDDVQLSAQGVFVDGRMDDVTATVSWQSSDTAVASFDASVAGLLHTTASGTIAVVASENAISSTLFALVVADTLTAVNIVAANTTVAVGATEQLTATGDYSDNTTRDVSANVSWSSATTSAATVDTAGLLTGVAIGTTVVTASCNTIPGTQTFTISAAGSATVVDVEVVGTPPFDVQFGSTLQLMVDAEFSDASRRDVTEEASWSVSSLASGAASVSNVAGSKGLVSTNFTGGSLIRVVFEGEEELIEINVL